MLGDMWAAVNVTVPSDRPGKMLYFTDVGGWLMSG